MEAVSLELHQLQRGGMDDDDSGGSGGSKGAPLTARFMKSSCMVWESLAETGQVPQET